MDVFRNAFPASGAGRLPAEADVRLGVAYGEVSQFVGNCRVPPPENVLLGYAYDTNDTVIGQLATDAGDVPAVTDVREGVTFGPSGSLLGVLQLPLTSQVLLGVGYGANGIEFEGTLSYISGGTASPLPPVLASGQIRSPLYIGDDYTAAVGRAFEWDIEPQTGFTVAAVARLIWSDPCSCDQPIHQNEGTVTLQGSVWRLSVDMPASKTSEIRAGTYAWAIQLVEGSQLITVEAGETDWVCP